MFGKARLEGWKPKPTKGKPNPIKEKYYTAAVNKLATLEANPTMPWQKSQAKVYKECTSCTSSNHEKNGTSKCYNLVGPNCTRMSSAHGQKWQAQACATSTRKKGER